jgi:hypothetical protein
MESKPDITKLIQEFKECMEAVPVFIKQAMEFIESDDNKLKGSPSFFIDMNELQELVNSK